MAAASVATSSAAPPTPASPASTPISRVTKGGRTLWYRLTVLQEPERARACGNGLKSTTDRRPVDPPPVVELRIYEGENLENVKDITFTYNANFFLFARLEHARPMANGRVNTPAANTPPVLTGMFVSGMAYLDRPSEAGYFLFPDLSVRHEGRYKLVFDLFENTKEDKDRSPDADEDESYDHRLRIESRAFNVYSAKKFPGLTQSTDLSRVISDQGCRVRIRRDVRMRRRETKRPGASDYESQVKDEFEHGQRTLTPETNHRARSASNASIDRTPHQDAYRRPSNAEYPPPPPSYGAAPSTPGSAGGHAHFGQPPASPYPSTPTQQQYAPHHHPTSIAPQPPYQPPAQPATHSYSHHRAPNQLQYPPLQAAPPPRQPSAPASHQYASERPLSRMNQQFHTLPQPSNSSSRRSSEILAPIKPLERDDVPRLTPIRAAPINSAPEENVLPPARDIVRGLPPPSSCKRPFGETFAVEGYNQKLSNRGRQQDPHMYPPSRVWTGYDEPYASRDPKYLSYSRANGEKQTKPMPAVSYS